MHPICKRQIKGCSLFGGLRIYPQPDPDNAGVGKRNIKRYAPFCVFYKFSGILMKKIILPICAMACIATANGANPKGLKIDTLKTYKLQDVQVTSTRAGAKTPMAIKNFGKEEIKSSNFGKDLPYLLSFTPSVTITSDAGNGIGYTTLRVRGTDPSRINITANGIPMNDAESSCLFWVNMGDFASSVQSIQIQRGVGSSSNGSGAFGASINMQTENISMKPFFGIDLSAGSYYSHKETMRFGTGLLNEHWALQGRLSNIGSKGYIRRAYAKLNSYFLQAAYFNDNTMLKFITFNGNEETYHAWNYTSKYEQSLYGRRYNSCGEYYDADGNTRYYKNQTDNYHQQNYQLILTHDINDLLKLNAALHYTKGEGYYEEFKGGKKWIGYGLTEDKTIKGDLIRQKKMDNDFYGAVANINYDNKNGFTASLGGGWNKYDGDHFGNVIWAGNSTKPVTKWLEPDFRYYFNNAKKRDGNAYMKANWEFLKGLSVFADMQYRNVRVEMQDPTDSYTGTYGGAYVINKHYNFFNPKMGLNYEFLNNHRLYISYAIAHKEPVRNNYENYYASLKQAIEDNAPSQALNEPSAERLNDLELGYQYHSGKFSFGANFYYMNYKDQFVLTGELDNIGEAITANLKKSYRMGVEIEAAWKPADWFRWDINATFSKNRVKDMLAQIHNYEKVVGTEYNDYVYKETVNLGDQKLAFSPDVIANNIFTFMYKGFKASVQSQYVSEQNMTNTGFKSYVTTDDNGNDVNVGTTIGSHFTTNIDLSYNFSIKKLGLKDATIGFTMYNLFSKEYDNNGWAAPHYNKDANGNVFAYSHKDQYSAGFAPSAPFNCMAHLSLNF